MDRETLNLAADRILLLNEDNFIKKCSGYEQGITDAIKVINYMIREENEKQEKKSPDLGEGDVWIYIKNDVTFIYVVNYFANIRDRLRYAC